MHPYVNSISFLLQHGNTPLHTAADNNHPEVVKALIAAGSDLNRTNKVGICNIYML